MLCWFLLSLLSLAWGVMSSLRLYLQSSGCRWKFPIWASSGFQAPEHQGPDEWIKVQGFMAGTPRTKSLWAQAIEARDSDGKLYSLGLSGPVLHDQ